VLLRALLVGVFFVGGACGGPSDATSEGEPRVEHYLAITDLKQFTLPLDAYAPTLTELVTIGNAENLLLQQCMRRFGLDIGTPPALQRSPFEKNELRYGLTSDERARTVGYRNPENQAQSQLPVPDLSPEAMAVAGGTGQGSYNGLEVPPGGCRGEARHKLAAGTDPAHDGELVGRLDNEAGQQAERDSRVRAAFATWSACMKRSGYDYADPWRANDDPAFGEAQAITAQELATATADVRCKKEANLVNIWASVETAYQNRVIAANEPRLQEEKAAWTARLRNAATVAG
jgi:hypothetical protein